MRKQSWKQLIIQTLIRCDELIWTISQYWYCYCDITSYNNTLAYFRLSYSCSPTLSDMSSSQSLALQCPTSQSYNYMPALNLSDYEAILFNNNSTHELPNRQLNVQPTLAGISVHLSTSSLSSTTSRSQLSLQNKVKNGKKHKKKRNALLKESIGTPINFVHVQHVEWHHSTGFVLSNVDHNIKQFLKVFQFFNK